MAFAGGSCPAVNDILISFHHHAIVLHLDTAYNIVGLKCDARSMEW